MEDLTNDVAPRVTVRVTLDDHCMCSHVLPYARLSGGVKMKAIRIALVALCLLAIPAVLQAQTWSPEQQELLDHLSSIWDQVEENNESSFVQWRDVVHPRDDLVWWPTD